MSTTRTSRRLAAAAATVLVAAAAAGCGSQDDNTPTPAPSHSSPAPTARPTATYSPPQAMPSGKAGTPKGLPTTVNEEDATAVAHALAVTAFTYDTALDRTPADAQRRAGRWLTPAYAKTALAQPVAPPGASWNQMAAHHGYTAVTARQAHDTAPASTQTSAYRQFEVTVQFRGRDGWKGDADEHWVTWIHLARSTASSPWKADSMRVST
ncbi:hypothetical protein ACJ6WD_35415 [Streptomyces sp. VTCC 41912]|uniref:hypothetical protein n=1 Tax=Streptomyces sp. VTCC 41912 TaxID=3383243 RepID=UPI003896E68F